jgi:C-terminal processing protease CtpA/Prc
LSSASTRTAALDVAERTELIPAISAALQAEYVFPDMATKMVQALQAHAQRGDYAAISDGKALATRLTADLRAVSHDGHLGAEYHPEGARTEPENWSLEDLKGMRAEAEHSNFDFRKVERMDGNVGYIDVRYFYDAYLAADTISAAMSFVAHMDALIIDLRQNPGGEPTGVTFFASFLFDTRTHLHDLLVRRGDRVEQIWTSQVTGPSFGGQKPVYVLVSKATFSGAECLAITLKELKRAVIVGETTGGGAHLTRQFKVTEHFAVWVPFGRGVSLITQTDWEGVGVTPDVAVPATDALRTAYRAALRRIAASTTDVAKKQAVEQLLAAPSKK